MPRAEQQVRKAEAAAHTEQGHEALRTPSLRASIFEGMAGSVMLGAGETYISAFAVFLGATAFQIGLLGTAPLVCSAVTQLAAVWLIGRVASRRSLLVRLTLVQALCWALIAALPAALGTGPGAVAALISIVLVYHGVNGLTVPVWNSLIGDMVPSAMRGFFFGRRSRFISIASFLSIAGAGRLLHLAQRFGNALAGYEIIFGIAAAARSVSSWCLSRHDDPPFKVLREHHFTFWDFLRRGPRSNFARFVFFAALVNFSVFFAAPYFAVYMLRDLGLDYFEYTVVLATAVVGQVITLQYWGTLSDRIGNKMVLDVSIYGVALVPLLWIFGSAMWWLIVIQLISGFAWAGYNLAVANFLFDAVTPPKRARCVAYQSAVNSVFLLAGSMLGAFTATHAGSALPFHHWFAVPASPYLFVFFVSALLRFSVALFLRSIFREVREVEPLRKRDLIFRVVYVRPPGRFVFRPIDSVTNGHENGDDDEEKE